MKKLLFVLSFTLISLSIFAATPPPVVAKAFLKMYPNAYKINWEQENLKVWTAEFVLDERNCTANFSNYGTWGGTETIITSNDLPLAVSDAIQVRYGSWIVRDVYKTETTKQGYSTKPTSKKENAKKKLLSKKMVHQ